MSEVTVYDHHFPVFGWSYKKQMGHYPRSSALGSKLDLIIFYFSSIAEQLLCLFGYSSVVCFLSCCEYKGLSLSHSASHCELLVC